jgi:hypothetical protein
VYSKTNILGLHTFRREKFSSWASNGICVEEVRTNFKAILCQGIEMFFPNKILRKYSDPEYYNIEVKPLKVKVRKVEYKGISTGKN